MKATVQELIDILRNNYQPDEEVVYDLVNKNSVKDIARDVLDDFYYDMDEHVTREHADLTDKEIQFVLDNLSEELTEPITEMIEYDIQTVLESRGDQ